MRLILTFFTVMAIGFFSCKEVKAQVSGQGASKKISAEEAHNLMAKMKSESTPYILLDVRSELEFNEVRIKDALLIPVSEIGNRAEKELTDKNKVIFVYCRSGGRSARATAELVKMGYKNVYDFGGIMDWKYETVKK